MFKLIILQNTFKFCNRSFSQNLHKCRSFINDLFVCRLNLDLLDYPELNSYEEFKETNTMFKRFQQRDTNNKVEGSLVVDGRLKFMQRCKLGETFEDQKCSLNINAINHTIITEAIIMWGNDCQKEKYLQKLSSDNLGGIFVGPQYKYMLPSKKEINIKVSYDGTNYILNGSKPQKIHGYQSSVLLVIAELDQDSKNKKNESIAFLVDSDQAGVFINVKDNSLELKDVHLSEENILGTIGSTEKILRRATISRNLMLSSICVGRLKSILADFLKFAQEREVFGVPLFSFEKVQEQLVNIYSDVFLSESMVYFVAGHLDAHESGDWLTESITTQIFCKEAVARSTDQLMNLLGHNGLNPQSFEEKVHNTQDLLNYEISTMCDRTIIARDCFQHFLTHYSEIEYSWILQLGCNLGVMSDVRCFSKGKSESSSVSSYLHPSMALLAQHLFINIRKISIHLNDNRKILGDSVLSDSSFLVCLSQWMVDIWPVLTALSRVSRAICLDLPTHKHQGNIIVAHFNKFYYNFNKTFKSKDKYREAKVDLVDLSKTCISSTNGLPHPIDL